MCIAHPEALDHLRSPKWGTARGAQIKRQPSCEGCGKLPRRTESANDVHHEKPFHEHPELELDLANLMTLCRRCHLLLGHLDDWQSHNPNVRRDAAVCLKAIRNRPARAAIRGLFDMNTEPKPGWRSSEFVAAMAPTILSALVLAGIIAPGDRATVEGAIVNGIAAAGTLLASAATLWKYIHGRIELKRQAVQPALDVRSPWEPPATDAH